MCQELARRGEKRKEGEGGRGKGREEGGERRGREEGGRKRRGECDICVLTPML